MAIVGLTHPGAVPTAYSVAEYKNMVARADRLGHRRRRVLPHPIRRSRPGADLAPVREAARAAVIAAGAARAAARERTGRETSAGSKTCTLVTLLPIGPNPCLPILSMAVPMSSEQRKAAAALLRERVPEVADIGRLFTKHGHELALVGGPVRDAFRGERPTDLDLTTDATPEQVLAAIGGWADATLGGRDRVRHRGPAQG